MMAVSKSLGRWDFSHTALMTRDDLVVKSALRRRDDAERRYGRSHGDRGNEKSSRRRNLRADDHVWRIAGNFEVCGS
jgi:hypothetical protein